MKFTFSKLNSVSVRHLLSELKRKKKNLTWHSRGSNVKETDTDHVASQISIKETYTDTLSVVPSQASFFTQRFFATIERVERYTWYVITIKMNHNVTQRFIETRQNQYYGKFS